MSTDTFEKIKIEIRSILLSSKHGVAEQDILNDYEQLLCQRLPFQELGFRDVKSLLRAMPDVATEVRSPNGDVIYHAVSDESTAHIHKLVSNQTTKKKKNKFPVRRGGGRGGLHRGSFASGRGGYGYGARSSLDKSTKSWPSRPRVPLLSRDGRLLRTPTTMLSSRAPLLSHNGHPVRTNHSYSSRAPLVSRGGRTGTPLIHPVSDDDGDHRDLADIMNEDVWNASETAETSPASKTTRAIFGRGATEHPSSHFDTDGLAHGSLSFQNFKIGVNHGKRIVSELPTDLPRLQSDLVDDMVESESPVHNLKIGINQTGKHLISKFDNTLRKKFGSSNYITNEDPEGSHSNFDLRDFLNSRRQHQSAEIKDGKNQSLEENRFGRKHANLEVGKTKRVLKESRIGYQRYVPPRMQRIQNQDSGANKNQAPTAAEDQKLTVLPPLTKVEPQPHLCDQNSDNNNWELLEDGELFLQAYKNYFIQRGKAPPEIDIIPGKIKKEKGYYGRLQHQDVHYYPLLIMKTEEQAQQSVAKEFCLKNAIPVNTKALIEKGTNLEQGSSSSSCDASQKEQQVQGMAELKNPEITSSQVPHNHQSTADSDQVSAAAATQHVLPDTLEKIYKILKPNGVWVLKLAELYQTCYAETLDMDFLSVARQWPEYFTLEETTPNRYIVYPVLDALASKPVINNNYAEKIQKLEKKDVMVIPPSLPPVGSKLEVLYSYAYSPVDLYVQRADMQNLVYEIEEVLNKTCPTTPSPSVDAVTVNSLMAAIYEEKWYRTQIVAVDKEIVSVYFIDYGNREKVRLAELRPIPQDKLVLNTPSLAIKCALRKSRAGDWCQDFDSVLTNLSEIQPFLTVEVLEHEGDQCVIDLNTPEGELVNDMLIQPYSTPPRQKTVPQKVNSTQKDKQESSKIRLSESGAQLFTDDPEPLMIPDYKAFVVYICRVMSENTVLLRIVDEQYSDKLDELEQNIAENFYSWPIPAEIKQSNIYAAMILAGAENAEDVEYDEEGRELLSDQNKYHRARVLKENKDGSYDCYLPDHGDNETVNRNQLRQIDPHLNLSLSYQAVMARLHGLDKLQDKMKPMAVRLLIKFLSNGCTYYAVKKGKSAEKKNDSSVNVDVNITMRVRKIISCMKDVQPAVVAKIYQNVYGEPVENVEEIIKNIPGYGYWRENLEVELFDTNQEDSDVNINESVLTAIKEMEILQSQGGNPEDVWKDLFSSNTSQADTDAGSVPDSWSGLECLDDSPQEPCADGNEAKLSCVEGSVQDVVKRSISQDDTYKSTPCRSLYTWNSKPETSDSAVSAINPSSSPLSSSSVWDKSCLPKFWTYPLLKFVSIHITRVENPSDFVAIPMEQRGALEKLEVAITQYFSKNSSEPATSLEEHVVYAVKCKDTYYRALYLNLVEDVVRVFFPDHHSYDTVLASELFVLPNQFYSLPFLAHRMCLGDIVPVGKDWPADVIQWFKTTLTNKCLYAVVTEEGGYSTDHRIPGPLVVQLVDTSGSEDLVVGEFMESQGMAAHDPKCE